MISLRARIFFVISVAVLLILSISVFLLISSKKAKEKAAEQKETVSIIDNTAIGENGGVPAVAPPAPGEVSAPAASGGLTVKPLNNEDAIKNGVRQLSKIFTERYNSFSTDSNFQNIRDVRDLVTKEYWAILYQKMTNTGAAPQFYGRTTEVLSTELKGFNENQAVVEAKTRITDEKNNTETISYQTANVYVKKAGADWLIDRFDWQK